MTKHSPTVALLIVTVFVAQTALATQQLTFTDKQLRNKPFYPALLKSVGGHPKETYTAQEVLASQQPKPVTFNAAEVKAHFNIVEKLDPTKTHLFSQLIQKFGKKARYTTDEVLVIESPTTTLTEKPPHNNSLLKSPLYPIDSFPRNDVRNHFKVEEATNPKTKASMENLDVDYPGQSRYTAGQIRNVEKNGSDIVYSGLERDETQSTFVAEAEAKANRSWFLNGWKTPLVRHDWTDVLLGEDLSLTADSTKSKVDDLVGATFSYTDNANAGTDTWATVGALIWPWVYNGSEVPSLLPPEIAIAPSVSVNRISTSGDPKMEVDQLFFRVGVFLQWSEPFGKYLDRLQVRGAPVFGTDTGFRARMPGYEFDLEPSWLFNNGADEDCKYKIGFKNILWYKSPLLEDSTDQSVLDYQIRIWIHLEGGDIQDVGKSFAATQGNFFRLGPVAQLRINSFFPVPLLSKGLSFTAQYSYLPTIDGPKGHDYLLSLTAALTILADKVNHQKLSLTGSYTNGGLIFTKQDVDTFTLGLSVLF